MSATTAFERATALEVRDQCLCFAAQRTARELARRFDRAFARLKLTNGQFSMMVSMGGMGSPKLGELARFLGMDHATATAAVRKLERRKLVTLSADREDKRARRVSLTNAGSALIAKAVPIWRAEHARLDAEYAEGDTREVRRQMMLLAPPLGRAAAV
jgi:DNA-binding MarR family transcriptional regulator